MKGFQYRLPKFNKFALIFMFSAFVIFGFSIAIFISNILYRPAVATSSALSAPSLELHFISLNKTQLLDSATSLAGDYQAIGAGGYIYKIDNYYHIFSSGFEIKNDAVLVQSKLSESQISSEIITVNFKGFNIDSNFNSEEKKVLQKSLCCFENAYKALFDIAISLDTAVYNEISARKAVNSVHASLSNVVADFKVLFTDNPEAKPLKILLKWLEKGSKITETLCTGKPITKNQTYNSLIKYRYIELLVAYQELSNEIRAL